MRRIVILNVYIIYKALSLVCLLLSYSFESLYSKFSELVKIVNSQVNSIFLISYNQRRNKNKPYQIKFRLKINKKKVQG